MNVCVTRARVSPESRAACLARGAVGVALGGVEHLVPETRQQTAGAPLGDQLQLGARTSPRQLPQLRLLLVQLLQLALPLQLELVLPLQLQSPVPQHLGCQSGL